jgi:exosortase
MNDRFLIPIAAAWLVHRNRPRWQSTPIRPSIWGLALVVAGAILWPPAWYLVVRVGPRVLLLWWLTAAVALAAIGLLIAQFGARRAWLAVFPIAFCFLALPTPDRLQTPIQLRLKEYTTSATAAVLPALGVPVVRRGYVLDLPSGPPLGVVDACSGVRSVSALTAIAIFVAYVRGFSIWRGGLLVLVTLGIVVISNSIRVIVTGVLQQTFGPEYAQGWAHELLGYTVILVGLALIVGVSSLLAPKMTPRKDDHSPITTGAGSRGGIVAVAALAIACAASLWSERYRAADLKEVDFAALPTSIGPFEGKDEPVDETVAEMLKCNQLLHRVYTEPLGRKFELYVMFWSTPASTAHMHHPDVCMTCQGWETDAKRIREVEYRPDRSPIPISVREYSQMGRRELVFYWTQSGSQLLPDGPEGPLAVSEYEWVKQMLFGQATIQRTSRLSVRIDAELTGDVAHQEELMAEYSAAIAREVYKLIPWAAPPQ